MPTRVTPGSGAEFLPHFNNVYGISSIDVINGGSGYASTDPPKIEIIGTKTPISEGIFYPIIGDGEIKKVVILDPGVGYLPETSTIGKKIGIQTTANVESSLIVRKGIGEDVYLSVASSESNIIMSVEGGSGTSIYENGYNRAISTSIVGTSATVVPDLSLNQNNFFGYFFPFPSYSTSGMGTDSKYSAFIVYNSSTGNAISTSLILREGGRGYAVGDTVSISGTFMNGSSPENDLSFVVSTVANTRIVSAANTSFLDLPSYNISGFGTGAKFNVSRDSLGDISVVSVSNGGIGYALTDRIGVSGTYIGGITPEDDLLLSPKILGTNELPEILYVSKLDDNNFKVSGLSTSLELDLISYGLGTQSFELDNSLESTIISIDNIIQSQIYKRDLNVSLASTVEIDSNYIYITEGISSITSLDIIQVNSELLKVKNLGVGATNEIEVERKFMGSSIGYHTVGAALTVLRGDFNIKKDTIYFSTPPYGPTGYPGNTVNSTFQGRVFSRQFDPGTPNDKNIIFDDISTQFVSASSTEFYLKSNSEDVVGIFTDTNSVLFGGIDVNNNPLILINNVSQISNTDFTVDTPGKNRLKFLTGSPSAGKISRTGISTGYGYQPLVSAGATVIVGAGGTIESVVLLGSGSGYRSIPKIELLSNVGSGASFTASIGAGGTITSISIVNPGSGYTSSPNPILLVGIPSSYSNLNLQYIDGYSGNGFGARASIVVGNQNNIIGFNMDNPGQYYKNGEILRVSGIVTDPTVGVGFSEFRITVEDTLTDKFSGFYPGQFVQFDNIQNFFTGTKKKFTLTVTENGITQLLSLKTDPSSDLKIENNLFVFINDILQEPFASYRFTGSRITLLEEAPKPNSKCTILFYRGSDLDVEEITPPKTIKEGDTIQIGESILDPTDREQFERVVKKIISSDSLDTFTYDSIGINTDPEKDRPLRWTKQTEDKIINGVLYSKSRPDLKSRIIPTTRLIKNVGQDDTQIYVDNAFPIFSKVDIISEDLRDIVIIENKDINPGIASAIVSSASTITSISIIDPGNNYSEVSPVVAISSSFIFKKDPIYNWKSASNGISTNYNINSIAFGNPIISVGSSGIVATSIDGTEWSQTTIGYGSSVNLNSVSVGNTNKFLTVSDSGRIFYSVGVGSELSSWVERTKLKEEVILGLPNPVISSSTYSDSLNSIHYSPFHDMWVIAGNSQTIFTGSGISTSFFFEKTPPMFGNLNSITSNSFRFVAVGESASIVYSEDGNIWTKVKGVASTKNFYDVIWTGDKFILVGESGDIFYSPSGSTWQKINSNLSVDLVKIAYEYGFYTALDSYGNLYFSFDLSTWILRDTLNENKINGLLFIDPPPPPEIRLPAEKILSEEGRYILVGDNGTIIYAEPIFNRATGISSVSSGSISSITITNPGFGYDQKKPPAVIIASNVTQSENIKSIKAKGDFGIIKYVGVGATTISFVLESENYDNINLGIGYSSLNTYGVTYSELEVGDYFTIFDSNSTTGHALTGITTSLGGLSNYPESKVGTATSYLDGVYRVESVSSPSSGIVTVRCNFTYAPNGFPIQVNVNTNENGIYGKYSWGKIYDYQSRSKFTPRNFYVNTDNGLVGLSTSPTVYRTRGLS